MPEQIPVTVIILTLNEQANLPRTVAALSSFRQIVVVDSGSTDRTLDICHELGVEVLHFSWNGRYPKKKQWALDHVQARYPWILLLDADEYPSPSLIEELRHLVHRPDSEYTDLYSVKLQYKFSGKYLSHGHRVVKRSVLKAGCAKFPDVNDYDLPGIGEVEGHYQPEPLFGAQRVGKLHGVLCHDDRDPLSSWFARHNRYSDWEAHSYFDGVARVSAIAAKTRSGRWFARVPAKPVMFFIYSYLFRLGFLDGRAGLDYAIANSFYYWQIALKRKELSATGASSNEG